MKGTRNLTLLIVLGLALILGVWGCNGCNKINTTEQTVKKSWGNVETNYQRRNDLYSSVIKTVEASANFEKSTLKEVVDARARAMSVTVNVDDQASLDRFQQAQGQMQGAFTRLMGYVESYPDLKTTKAFQDFQAQQEGTENRINTSRIDYNKSVEDFNKMVVRFPTSLIASMIGKKEKPYYKADPGTEKVPDVNFNIK